MCILNAKAPILTVPAVLSINIDLDVIGSLVCTHLTFKWWERFCLLRGFGVFCPRTPAGCFLVCAHHADPPRVSAMYAHHVCSPHVPGLR